MSRGGQLGVVIRLGTTQTLAWASTYYLPALLARPLADDLGFSVTQVYAAFTLALIISGLVGPQAGRYIDDLGGRKVLLATNVLFACGLVCLGLAQSEWQMWGAWAVIGLAMGSGLYDAAFATLVRLYPVTARQAITGITLIAGFASTVGWPLTSWWLEALGWRGTCLAWAGLHLILGMPLHRMLPTAPLEVAAESQIVNSPHAGKSFPEPSRWMALSLATVFAITWFTSTAMAAHLPTLLQAQGLNSSAALAVAMLVGPAQVAGRILEFVLLRKVHPLLSARLAAAAHPMGVLGFMTLGPACAWLFAGLHGAGNGILTIAKGTLPLVVFGASGYGQRQGWLMVPARIAQAMAPVLFGMAFASWGSASLWLTAALGLLCWLILHGMTASMTQFQGKG